MNGKINPMTAAATLLVASALAVGAQSLRGLTAASDALPGTDTSGSALAQPKGGVLKEIDDPCTGNRWLLFRDPADPAGPGRLVLAAGDEPEANGPASRAAAPLIHAGDKVIVEEHTAVVEAKLEAVALSRALTGAQFQARLKIGGKVVRVVAVAPGRAVFAPEAASGIGTWR